MKTILAVLLAAPAQAPSEPPRTTARVSAPQAVAPPVVSGTGAETGLVGAYSLQDGDPNGVAVLELIADGRFRFAMSAGYLKPPPRAAGRATGAR